MSRSLAVRMKELLSTAKGADIQFLLFQAHKSILISASDPFEAMFRFDVQNTKNKGGKAGAPMIRLLDDSSTQPKSDDSSTQPKSHDSSITRFVYSTIRLLRQKVTIRLLSKKATIRLLNDSSTHPKSDDSSTQMKSIRTLIEQQQRRKASKRTRKSSEFDDSSVFITQSEGNDDEEPASDECDAENRPPVEFQCGKTERGAFCIWTKPLFPWCTDLALVAAEKEDLRQHGPCQPFECCPTRNRRLALCVHALLPGKQRKYYEETLNAVKAMIAPNTPAHIISDFETATIRAMRETFPAAQLTGCLFHMSQAVFRKWREIKADAVQSAPMPLRMPNTVAGIHLVVEQLIGDALDEAEYNTDEDVMNILSLLSLQMQGYVDGLRARGAQHEHEDRE
ncbi:hypothetical protein niasHT_030320 [Heterodera trifolii]|uniref:MULE transposase domain-containing protein n=1 Tax=Heterodera trifolii TaxID=157864 RepID=A0ABD2KR86_9BILA